MIKYEYKIEEIRKSKFTGILNVEENNQILKKCGEEGWKLIEIQQTTFPLVFVFERVIDEKPEYFDYMITQGDSTSKLNPILNTESCSVYLTGLGLTGWKVSKIIGGYPHFTYFILERPL